MRPFARYDDVRCDQRLGVDFIIDGPRKQTPELVRVHIIRLQHRFIQVRARAPLIIVLRQHSDIPFDSQC